ncbi:MAG TPA: hypothetical protein PKK61_01395 [Defluviitaleaceae bacterium]|jgi:hypothetical protein|nr:hypothetical protein [Candidatus Epulonipiscium sp.]HOA79706.1 hypothetical protein [Defluviitaleaceae bacterium]
MKRYFSLMIFMILAFILLSGCEISKSIDPIKKEDDTGVNNELDEGAKWEASIHETVNNLNGVSMTVKEGTLSSKSLTLILENNSDKDCIFSSDFILEKKVNKRWYQVPVILDSDYGFEDIAYELSSSSVRQWPVDWNWLYGNLDAGEYRIIKSILNSKDTGDFDNYYLAAEFIIN